ncbi:hypothetical protein MKX08_009656 [Trichoderma sp. CBMAI-0020]|nr:hypothetical protein MKX08_009656 [Trichoderma sp. CBMAI-0020]
MSSSSSELEYRPRDRRRDAYPTYDRYATRRPPSRDESPADSRNSSLHSGRFGNKIVGFNFAGGIRVIEIWSKHLVDAIEKVNKHPPLEPTKGFFSEQEPYPTLFYHMDDIKAEIAHMDGQDPQEHLKTLQRELAHVEPIWMEARQESSDMVSYDMIWTLFRPGDLVLREDRIGNLWLFVLTDLAYIISRSRRRADRAEKKTFLNVLLLNWNEVDSSLSNEYMSFNLPEFSGKRHITSLPIYPIRYQEDMERKRIQESLARRGRKWQELINAASICQHHCGLAFKGNRQKANEKFRADGRIVIDQKSKDLAAIGDILGAENGLRETEFQARDRIAASAALSDEQAMLCPAVVGCHDLKSKQTYTVSVDNLQPIEWNKDAMDHLVLDTRKKEMLQGLVRHHSSRSRRSEKGDLIAGKGQSLVILLHGPPGVGKTLTAESIAEAVGKPLVAMSIGEMVWDEMQLQERLKSEFQRAIDWDAVLLLDEADVVLEARSFEDVRRNGIVSIFLRELEYYQGILFLTTNRVSTMDTAFQSRIQIGVGFQSMTPKIRADVWRQLLTLNGRDEILGSEALKNIQTRLNKYELNGRQIRNVLNVAEGLAFQEHGEEGKLEYRHIEEATKAAAEFQKMLEESKSMMKLEQTVWAPYKGDDDESIF